ncbi:hypothetical protein [Roseovarius sp. D22-M7]|uniref:hypothetical protein n=1 Tax=Roseovarius sp. D22-M7 TaxID=3127116 RepID=UPI00300FC146
MWQSHAGRNTWHEPDGIDLQWLDATTSRSSKYLTRKKSSKRLWAAKARHIKNDVKEQWLDGGSAQLRANTLGADPKPDIHADLFGKKRVFDAISHEKTPHSQGRHCLIAFSMC